MAQIERLRPLLRTFEKLERESRRKNNGKVNVGYAASYAIYVHENLEAAHGEAFNLKHARGQHRKRGAGRGSRGPDQQAKFLEKPFREMRKELMSIVRTAAKGRVPLIKALLLAGLALQRASQKIVPVDTGNLKGSAFTEEE